MKGLAIILPIGEVDEDTVDKSPYYSLGKVKYGGSLSIMKPSGGESYRLASLNTHCRYNWLPSWIKILKRRET